MEGSRHSHGLAVGDIDGDGLDDLYYGAPLFDGSETAVDGGIVCSSRSLPDRTKETFPGDGGYCYYSPVAGTRRGESLVAGDFDGDGRDEVAHSTPLGTASGVTGAGSVDVIDFDPDTGSGSWITLDQSFTSSHTDPEAGDRFGDMLAAGDFDGDGYDDLVVGTPMEDFGSDLDVGVVQVFYGGASGLQPLTNQTFFPGNGGMLGNATPGEHAGAALATGDFDGDQYDDLAFSAPDRPVTGRKGSGEVHVLYGSAGGLSTTGQDLFSDWSFGLTTIEEYKRFGAALAAGDFDGDASTCSMGACYDELAIGVPGATVSGQTGAGKVRVLPGSSAGLGTTGATILSALDTAVAVQGLARFGAR